MVSTTPMLLADKSLKSIQWGYLNVGGLKSHMNELLDFMDNKGLSFLILSETWLRPHQIISNPAIVWDIRVPRYEGPGGRGVGGIMVIRNTKITTPQDFNGLEIDHDDHS